MSLYSREELKKIIDSKEHWTAEDLAKTLARMPERQSRFTTISDVEIDRVYSPADLEGFDYEKDLGWPGKFPYTRGVHPTGYRGKPWTIRLFSGFGTPEQTNKRYRHLLSQGQDGLSVAFHLPNLMGRDSDDPRSRGEVGRCGVAMDTLRDMETLFDGITLEKITTSMTTNAPAAIMLSMYLAVAEKQGGDWKKLGGTTQNDILKEYIAQKTWIFPPRPSMRIFTDFVTFCTEAVPKWNTISISGYHIREAGSTAAQELAFTLYDGLEYVKYCVQAGLSVDQVAPRFSFFFNAHSDFFEEIAKYRAARRMWARLVTERFQPKDERSRILRFHTQTAGCSLTAQQPLNNIVRTAIQALSGVLGGTQSMHTNSMDETLALPSDEAVMVALRTQQIIQEETGVTNTVDPLGGSFFIESLTNELEEEAMDYVRRLDELGGMIPAIEKGFPQQEIHKAALHYHRQCEQNEKIMVGVNKYVQEETQKIPLLEITDKDEKAHVEHLRKVKTSRDAARHKKALDDLSTAAKRTDKNLMPPILDAVRAYASVGEICDTLRGVFGEYRDPGMY
ncbi:MAG: methylmalonyl-CoA mutase family protein [Bdellovibrionota bacterium]